MVIYVYIYIYIYIYIYTYIGGGIFPTIQLLHGYILLIDWLGAI